MKYVRVSMMYLYHYAFYNVQVFNNPERWFDISCECRGNNYSVYQRTKILQQRMHHHEYDILENNSCSLMLFVSYFITFLSYLQRIM